LLAFHKLHGKILHVSGVRTAGTLGELDATTSGKCVIQQKRKQSGGASRRIFFGGKSSIFDFLEDREESGV